DPLVTVVQTCALPICPNFLLIDRWQQADLLQQDRPVFIFWGQKFCRLVRIVGLQNFKQRSVLAAGEIEGKNMVPFNPANAGLARSEERRVGKEESLRG